MKCMWYGCWVGIFSLFLMSCTSNSPLELALELAGDNSLELKKVLQYYSDNPQKQKAAEYLIVNMPYHFSRESFFVNRGGEKIRPDVERIADKRQMSQYVDSLQRAGYWMDGHNRYDIHVIDSEYLIRHIELAFDVWCKPWARDVSFDDFCRYILPYRSQCEMLSDTREMLRDHYLPLLDSAGVTSTYEACLLMNARLKKDIRYADVGNPLSATVEETFRSGRGTCDALCDYAIHAMRSVGIPVVVRQTLWTRMDRGHVWGAVLSEGQFHDFNPADIQAGEYADILYSRLHLRPAKVYQRHYDAVSDYRLPGRNDGYATFLKNPLLVDVSSLQQVPDYTLRIPVNGNDLLRKDGILYLCAFNNHRWCPVAMGRYDGAGQAVFEHVLGRNIFIVSEYDEAGSFHYVSFPVCTYEDGSVSVLSEDMSQKVTHTFLKEDIGKAYSLGYWDSQQMRFVDLFCHVETDSTQTYINIPANALLYYRSGEFDLNNRVGIIDNGIYKRTHEW